jgi:hypothetical protein
MAKIGKINRKIASGRATAHGLENIAEQAGGIARMIYPMTGIAVTVFEFLAALALGIVIGRIWQIRHDEVERRSGSALPTVARSAPNERRNLPSSTSTAHCYFEKS